jgi:hypothetical protein
MHRVAWQQYLHLWQLVKLWPLVNLHLHQAEMTTEMVEISVVEGQRTRMHYKQDWTHLDEDDSVQVFTLVLLYSH